MDTARLPWGRLVGGNPGDMTPVRWVTWIMTAGTGDMMTRDRIQKSRFEGEFTGVRVEVVKLFVPKTIETIAVADSTEYAVPQILGAASTANET